MAQDQTWQDLFIIASQCGITPNEMLDMDLQTFRAVVEGYQDHLFDLKCLNVLAGYWAGYYSGNSRRKPKPVNQVLEELSAAHQRAKVNTGSTTVPKPKPDVDVAGFQEMERQFQSRMQRK